MATKKKDWSVIKRKVDLYILSLWLLFIFFIIITVKVPICFGEQCKFIGWWELITNNIIPIISMIFVAYGFIAYKRFKYDTKGSAEIPFEIKKVESINYEHLTFLATYVIPLITFDFEKARYIYVLVLLLVVMGIIYIKTDLFYANPSLALLGFHIYKVEGEFKGGELREGMILIARRHLNKGDKVRYIKLDDRVYYSDN
ncbi:TPA: anti-phage protein KwaA [Yersinia enterocolitica]|uniref:anti-phage protein KwaA n=1 Tax=Yersinia enterocolitica TaxID=630 RepID=UPI003552A150